MKLWPARWQSVMVLLIKQTHADAVRTAKQRVMPSAHHVLQATAHQWPVGKQHRH